jgi:hypothetical protein
MRFSGYIITGAVVGLSICCWLTLTHPRTHGDQDLVRAQPSLSPEPTVTPSPSGAPVVAGQAIIKIAPFNVSLIVADPIVDLAYGDVKDGAAGSVGFTTETLLAKYPACKAGALGTLVRVKAPTPSPTPSRSPSPTPSRDPVPSRTPANQPFKKTIDGYTYTYRAPAFTCATDQPGRNALAAAVAAVKNQALPTLVTSPTATPSPSSRPTASSSPNPHP